MLDDDLEPQKKKKVLKKLDSLSLDELRDYIAEMKEEILRAEGEIARKSSHMSAAAALFKTTK
jgi:uncharacterized small protein (DUF1192 family)